MTNAVNNLFGVKAMRSGDGTPASRPAGERPRWALQRNIGMSLAHVATVCKGVLAFGEYSGDDRIRGVTAGVQGGEQRLLPPAGKTLDCNQSPTGRCASDPNSPPHPGRPG